jgi:hypothetical protein
MKIVVIGDAGRTGSLLVASHFGVLLEERSLTPGANARLSSITLADWLREPIPVE